MKKIKLELESLSVETFSVEADPSARAGTIAGHADTEAGTCPESCMLSCAWWTCNNVNTNCVCEPVGDETVFSCVGPSQVYSCAWTGCDNCNATPNEAMSCQMPC